MPNGEQVQPQQGGDDGGDAGNGEPLNPRRSTRIPRPPDQYDPTMDLVMLSDCDEPCTYTKAMKRDDHVKWEKAMKFEMDSLHKNGTWDLVPLPKGKKAHFCKWVYKMKVVPGDDKPKYKARLVVKGFEQEHGIDFDEIFMKVVKMTTLCMVLGLAAHEDMELSQMDVKTAFLHGDLHEDIYMEQLVGHAAKGKEHLVCKLKKSLYGLKQAPREWYQKFDTFMRSQGYMTISATFSFAHHFLQAPSSSESKARPASSCTLRTSSRLAGIFCIFARHRSPSVIPLNRLLEARSILGWKQTVLEAVQPRLKRLRITPTNFTQFLLAFNLCKPVRLNTSVICSSLLRRRKSSGVFFKLVEILACHLKALQGAKMEGHAA
ncbi:hypothetical protein L7F22_065051 [Adiantum nelumboides]|nr:hypothetical protein [Adiantum nelumboides]